MLPYTIQYHITPYHTISDNIYSTKSNHTTPQYHIIPYVIPYHTTLPYTIQYHITSYHILYNTISHHTTPCHTISDNIYSTISNHTTPHQSVSYHITPYTMTYHMTPHQCIPNITLAACTIIGKIFNSKYPLNCSFAPSFDNS